jgi:hypothetical protein
MIFTNVKTSERRCTSENSASCWTAALDGKVMFDMMKAKKAGDFSYRLSLAFMIITFAWVSKKLLHHDFL